MKRTYSTLILLFFIFQPFSPAQLWSQDTKKEGSHYSNFETFESYLSVIKSDSIKKAESHIYLTRAKLGLNDIKIADGYFFLSEAYSETDLGLIYADSIIQVTKQLNNERYPALGYLQKGIQQYYLSQYSEALDNYLVANDYATKTNNEFLQLRVKHCIALLKNLTNKNKEALDILRTNFNYFDSEEKKNTYNVQYLKTLYALAISYNKNKKIDSSLVISKLGIIESQKGESNDMYPSFLKSYSRSKLIKKEFDIALIDSLKKAVFLAKNSKTSLADSYGIISDIYHGIGDTQNAITYLEKVDSLYVKSPELIFYAHRAYELLITHYASINDNENKSKATDKLLDINDKVIIKYQKLADDINSKYDNNQRKELTDEINRLSKQSEELISNQRKDKSKNSIIILSLSIGVLLLVAYSIIRNNIYKKRFKKLFNEHKSLGKNNNLKTENRLKSQIEADIPKDIITSVLKQLELFENSQKFSNHYTLNSLAKELGTNSAYLSKIINTYKHVNFANYINNLRIDFIVEKLKNDSVLRSYTIEAISKEAGFNNAQSFSTAFNKRTGIYPSYFLKKLNVVK